jgi:hypothetical protein
VHSPGSSELELKALKEKLDVQLKSPASGRQVHHNARDARIADSAAADDKNYDGAIRIYEEIAFPAAEDPDSYEMPLALDLLSRALLCHLAKAVSSEEFVKDRNFEEAFSGLQKALSSYDDRSLLRSFRKEWFKFYEDAFAAIAQGRVEDFHQMRSNVKSLTGVHEWEARILNRIERYLKHIGNSYALITPAAISHE